jgi:hypothetical protein
MDIGSNTARDRLIGAYTSTMLVFVKIAEAQLVVDGEPLRPMALVLFVSGVMHRKN